MVRRKITIADICAVSGYNRDKLHGLLKSLPLYAEHHGSARVAREFTRHDVLVLSIAVCLETKYGLQRAAVAAVVDQIHAELLGPRPTRSSPLLRISVDPPSAEYFSESSVAKEGTIVALEPVFKKIDAYLDFDSVESNPQPSLPFGPSLATKRKLGGM